MAGAAVLLLALKVLYSSIFQDIVDFCLSFLPLIIILILSFSAYLKYRKHPENKEIIRKKTLFTIFQFLLITLLFYILYSPKSFTPYLSVFELITVFFTLESYFLMLAYFSLFIIAIAAIQLAAKAYLKSQRMYRGNIKKSARHSLYAVFFIFLLLLASSVSAFPQAYSPLKEYGGDLIYNLTLKKDYLPADNSAHQRITSVKEAFSQTYQNLKGNVIQSNQKFTANIKDTKDSLDSAITITAKDLKNNLSEDIGDKLNLSGGTITGDLTLEDNLRLEDTAHMEDILPQDDNAYDLGSVSQGWENLHIHRLYGSSSIIVGGADTSHSLNSSGDLIISGKLEVNGAVYLDSATSLGGILSLNSYRITNLAEPMEDQDAATKNYADNLVGAAAFIQRNSLTSTIYPTNSGDSFDILNGLIVNVGNAGTDFTSTGGLNLAGNLNLNGLLVSSSTGAHTLGPVTFTDGVITGVTDLTGAAGTITTLDGTTLTYTSGTIAALSATTVTTTTTNTTTLDLGTNTVTDGNLNGNWSFNSGNLSGIGTIDSGDITATGISLSGDLNMGNNVITNIGNAGTDFTSTGGLNLADTLALGANDLTMTGSIGTTGSRVTKLWTAALESTADITINGATLTSTYQPLDAGLQNLAGVAMAADKFYYTTADNTHTAGTVTSFARSILDDASEATFKATVNLEIGTDVQAADAGLLSLAGLTYASDSFIKMTGADAYAVRTLAETLGDLSGVATGAFDWNSQNLTSVGTIGCGAITSSGLLGVTVASGYAATFMGGNVGIGTTGPDRKLDVLDASNPQMRLSQADGTVYADFQMDSNGDLIMNVDGQSNQLVLDNSGNIGIGETSPAAYLHIKAGTAAAGTAPLKFTSGTLNTTAEAGAMEFLTDAFYGTVTTSAVRQQFATDLNTLTFTNKTLSTGSTWNGTAIGDGYLTKSGDWTGTLDTFEGADFLRSNASDEFTTGNTLTLTGNLDSNGEVSIAATTVLFDGTSADFGFMGDWTVNSDDLVVKTSGNVGINTTGPDRRFEVLDASDPQLRLTHTDTSYITDFQVDGAGDLTITPSGGNLLNNGNLWVSDGAPAFTSVSGSGNLIVENLVSFDSDYRQGCDITYKDAATITVGAGEVMIGEAQSKAEMRKNTSSIDVAMSANGPDGVGSTDDDEVAGTDYFVYAVAGADVSTFTVEISKYHLDWEAPGYYNSAGNSTAPTITGTVKYRLLGYFHNDAESDIIRYSVTNNSNLNGKTLAAGIPLPGMVKIPTADFAVDIYEVTANDTAPTSGTAADWIAVSAYNAAPWTKIKQSDGARGDSDDAFDACENSGKRLVSSEEWLIAAQQTPDPDSTDPGANDGNGPFACNIWNTSSDHTDKPDDAVWAGSQEANSVCGGNGLGSSYTCYSVAGSHYYECTCTGTNKDISGSEYCKSKYGIYDMVGNVREWNSDTRDMTDYDQAESWRAVTDTWFQPNGSISSKVFTGYASVTYVDKYGQDGVYLKTPALYGGGDTAAFRRGGFWADGARAGVVSLDLSSAPANAGWSIGFRCSR